VHARQMECRFPAEAFVILISMLGNRTKESPRQDYEWNALNVALTPATGSLSVGTTLEYVRGFDPQDHSGFALKKRIFVATQVLSGEHVYMLGRALLGTTLVDNGSAYHYGPPRILRVDDRDCYSWIAIDVVRLEMTHDGID
jgi:hypothetical protein